MFNFTPSQRNALIFFSCLFTILLITAAYLRLIKSSRLVHTLFVQPTPMQARAAAASQPPAPPSFPTSLPSPPRVRFSPASRPALRTPLNVNSASTSELEALPEVGPALASRIFRYREVHGPFHMAEDLLKVEGIGPKTLEKIRPYIVCGPE